MPSETAITQRPYLSWGGLDVGAELVDVEGALRDIDQVRAVVFELLGEAEAAVEASGGGP